MKVMKVMKVMKACHAWRQSLLPPYGGLTGQRSDQWVHGQQAVHAEGQKRLPLQERERMPGQLTDQAGGSDKERPPGPRDWPREGECEDRKGGLAR